MIEEPTAEPPDGDDDRVREEADAAAREAAAIGGGRREDEPPEEERPLAEAGQGESEGFEVAERDLERSATHEDPMPDPTHLAGEDEGEEDPAEYADADDALSDEEHTEGPEGP